MGASRIMIWQYITAIILIAVLAGHLAERFPLFVHQSYDESLNSQTVYSRYKSPWGIGLLILAYVALFHGLNGIRGMLYEWLPGRRREKLWDALFWILFIIFAIVATYTVVALPPLPK
jgi:succinate dehydrogenase / fumarate reductase membrane anchor subunit